jgi:hypothetical protein
MIPRALLWTIVPVLLGGCYEPFDMPGTWHATGVAQANTDAQTINKADAVAGRGQPGSDATLDAAAVNRLYDDKLKALHYETTSGGGS